MYVFCVFGAESWLCGAKNFRIEISSIQAQQITCGFFFFGRRIAAMWRQKFHRDCVVDIVCYRYVAPLEQHQSFVWHRLCMGVYVMCMRVRGGLEELERLIQRLCMYVCVYIYIYIYIYVMYVCVYVCLCVCNL